MKEKISPVELCSEVGVDHLQWVAVMRRIRQRVMADDVEVITKTVGTFYRQSRRPTTKTLNGIVYQVPAREVIALRGPRFPGRELVFRFVGDVLPIFGTVPAVRVRQDFTSFVDQTVTINTLDTRTSSSEEVTIRILVNFIDTPNDSNTNTNVNVRLRIRVFQISQNANGLLLPNQNSFDSTRREFDSGILTLSDIRLAGSSTYTIRITEVKRLSFALRDIVIDTDELNQ